MSLSQNNMNIDCLKILMFTLWQSAKSKRLLPLCSKYIKLSNIISEHGTILDFFFLFCETFLSTRFPCVWCSLVNTIYNWHFKSSPERSAYFWATSRSCCLFIILFENVFSSRMYLKYVCSSLNVKQQYINQSTHMSLSSRFIKWSELS